MSTQFETPENVMITYHPAGFGSRLIAYLIDQLVLLVVFCGLTLVVVVVAISRVSLFADQFGEWENDLRGGGLMLLVSMMVVAFMMLILGNALVFFVMELLSGGRTVGKKIMHLRVVKTNGFTLDAVAVAMRNIMRVIDFAMLLPPLLFPTLLVAFVTKKRQRLGDLVAGTMVVHDAIPAAAEWLELRENLEHRELGAVEFKIDTSRLPTIPREWISAAEKTLARWDRLPETQPEQLRARLLAPLAEKCGSVMPVIGAEKQFLADFLTAVYQREYRQLG